MFGCWPPSNKNVAIIINQLSTYFSQIINIYDNIIVIEDLNIYGADITKD